MKTKIGKAIDEVEAAVDRHLVYRKKMDAATRELLQAVDSFFEAEEEDIALPEARLRLRLARAAFELKEPK